MNSSDFKDTWEGGASYIRSVVGRSRELRAALSDAFADLQSTQGRVAIASHQLAELVHTVRLQMNGEGDSAKPAKRNTGCVVEGHGKGLTLRFRMRLEDGTLKRCRERTGLADTVENRAKLEQYAELIAAELKTGRFKYEEWFPQSVARHAERQRRIEIGPWRARSGQMTLQGWFDEWIVEKRSAAAATPPGIRQSLLDSYEQHFEDHLLPAIGTLPLTLEEPSRRTLKRLRETLRLKKTPRGNPLSEKTIRNIIDSTLRAAIRDAAADDVKVNLEGFSKLDWAEYDPPEATPFSEEERDRLLEYLKTKQWKTGGFLQMGAHYPYYAYAFTLFFSALRPSEASAVRLRHVELDGEVGKIHVRASRHRGAEAGPKTRTARRTAKLTAENVEVLRPLIPLHPEPEMYLFRDVRGEPIKAENFYHLFVDAQRALSMTPIRDLYSTKDTFVSWARRHHVHDVWLEQQTGVAIQTLKKHYAGPTPDDDWDRNELAKIERKPPVSVPRTNKNRGEAESA